MPGDAPPEILDDLEIARAVGRPQHPAQHRHADVLQRHVHVRAHLGQRRHRVDQLGIDGRRIQVQQPDPCDAVDRIELRQQMREPAAPEAAIAPPHRRVLRDEDQLFGAAGRERARLGEDRLLGPRAKFSAQLRDDAERARVIAAFGDLQVRGGRRRRDEPRQKIMFRFGLEPQAHGLLAGPRVVEQLDDRRVRAGADHAVDLRDQRLQLVAEPLRQAPRDDELLPGALALGVLEDRLGRLGLGRVDERARVDHHRVRAVGLGDERPPRRPELRDHHLAVDEVLRAPEGDERDGVGAFGGSCHR